MIIVQPARQTALWLIVVLLAVIATTLILRNDANGGRQVFADSPMAGAKGIFAFTGQLDANRHGLFMMDADAQNVWCYEYIPNLRKARLVFARSFEFDRYLKDFNLDKDTAPSVIGKMLEEQRRIRERNEANGQGSGDESDEALGTMAPASATTNPDEVKP